MYSKNELRVLELFKNNIFLKTTILQLTKILKNKNYARIHETIIKLKNKKILNIEKIGNSSLVQLSFSNESISLLSFIEESNAFSKNIPNIEKILDFKEFQEDIIVITGSYSGGKETKKSDIDVIIITKEDAFKKQKLLENMTLSFHPVIHPIAFTQKDFMGMLLSKESSLGKEMFNNHLVFKNAENYYRIIKEAVEHGFKG